MQSLQLKGVENTKIECAKRFFNELNKKIDSTSVEYDVVDSYESLMKIIC